MAQHLEGLMSTSMEKIRDLVDVNTIIGNPVTTPDGTTIIPISKVSFGFASGGSDFPSKTNKELFGGGAGAGISVTPTAFIVINNNDVRMLQISKKADATDKAIDMLPALFDKITALFKKDEDKPTV